MRTLALTLSTALLCLAAGAPAGAADYKIGVFDSARVIMESQAGQQAQQRLNAFKSQRQEQITAREKELESLQNDFVNRSLTMSEEMRQARREELEDKKREFQRFYQDNERDLVKEMEKVQKSLQGELTKVIEDFGARNGYDMIFERLQCVFNSEAVDITGEIIQAFDAQQAGRR